MRYLSGCFQILIGVLQGPTLLLELREHIKSLILSALVRHMVKFTRFGVFRQSVKVFLVGGILYVVRCAIW